MSISTTLLTLAPADLPLRREERYEGDGFSVSLAQFAPEDVALIRQLYQSVKKAYDLWLYMRDAPDYSLMREQIIEAFGSDQFLALAQAIGAATYALGNFPSELSKVVHDIRGGALMALTGCVPLLQHDPSDERTAKTVLYARDHAKMMRNAIFDLDIPVRKADEGLKLHQIDDFVHKWQGGIFNLADRKVAIEVTCLFEGSISNRCLENSAIDRILYNYINNSARFSADNKVKLTIFPVGTTLVRWVVENKLAQAQQDWLAREVGPDLKKLFYGGLTQGGHGIGLSNCTDFVKVCFGVPTAAETLAQGYLGATVNEDTYFAWFHWPAYIPDPTSNEAACDCED